jgi:hypothetical protein
VICSERFGKEEADRNAKLVDRTEMPVGRTENAVQIFCPQPRTGSSLPVQAREACGQGR